MVAQQSPRGGAEALEVRWWPVARVHPAEDNPRTIPPEAVAAVAESIRAFGWRQPLVVEPSGAIIAGHTRLQAAALLGYSIVPVVVAADLTPDEAKALRVIDNRSGDLTSWDAEKLCEVLDDIPAGLDIALDAFDFDGLLASLGPAPAPPSDRDQAPGDGAGAEAPGEDTPAKLRAKLARVVDVLTAARPSLQPAMGRRADAALRFAAEG